MNATTWTRDASYRVTRIDHPDGSYEAFTYNGFGQPLTHRLRNGATESDACDAAGLRYQHINAAGECDGFSYDWSDRLGSG